MSSVFISNDVLTIHHLPFIIPMDLPISLFGLMKTLIKPDFFLLSDHLARHFVLGKALGS
jgi:hypothetical protein